METVSTVLTIFRDRASVLQVLRISEVTKIPLPATVQETSVFVFGAPYTYTPRRENAVGMDVLARVTKDSKQWDGYLVDRTGTTATIIDATSRTRSIISNFDTLTTTGDYEFNSLTVHPTGQNPQVTVIYIVDKVTWTSMGAAITDGTNVRLTFTADIVNESGFVFENVDLRLVSSDMNITRTAEIPRGDRGAELPRGDRGAELPRGDRGAALPRDRTVPMLPAKLDEYKTYPIRGVGALGAHLSHPIIREAGPYRIMKIYRSTINTSADVTVGYRFTTDVYFPASTIQLFSGNVEKFNIIGQIEARESVPGDTLFVSGGKAENVTIKKEQRKAAIEIDQATGKARRWKEYYRVQIANETGGKIYFELEYNTRGFRVKSKDPVTWERNGVLMFEAEVGMTAQKEFEFELSTL